MGYGLQEVGSPNTSRSMFVTGHATSLPVEDNGFSLDPDLKDAWGLPALRMTYRDHPDDLKTAKYLQDRAMEMLAARRRPKCWPQPIQEQTHAVHLLGTCRMGNDPEVVGDQRRSPHS